MGGPLLLHSDTTRSGSNILTSRTKWPEECSPRGAFLSVPAVPAARMQNFNKSYKHRINTKSFIHNGGRFIINSQQIPTGDFFVGKASILEESWIYMPLFDKMYSIFRQPPTHSAAFTWQSCHYLRHWHFWLKSAATGCKKCLAKSLRLFKGIGGIGHIGRQHKTQLTTQCFGYLWLYRFWICHCTPHLAMMFGIHSIRINKVRIFHTYVVSSWYEYLYPCQSKTSKQSTWNIDIIYIYISTAPSWPLTKTGQITSPTLPPTAVGLHNTTIPANSMRALPYCQQEALQWKDAFEPQVMFLTTVGHTSWKSHAKNWHRCMQHNDLPCKIRSQEPFQQILLPRFDR